MTEKVHELSRDYPTRPVPFTDVELTDQFWAPRLATNLEVTVPIALQRCEETGRIDNFAKAGGLMEGDFVGIAYDDSDVYKAIEAAAYSLTLKPDEKLDAYLDGVIAKIAAAQEPDGYLYTHRTLRPDNPDERAGKTRWSHLEHSHELYNVGHTYEAAVAHFQATGKRTLLDVAIRNADLLLTVFGPDKLRAAPGHQEIEIGLVKLYRVTGNEQYLSLARFFLDERGHAHDRELYGEYSQDHLPVTEQKEAVGHAVRAGYMYAGMADVASLTGSAEYIDAVSEIWRDVVGGKLYITGGMGARHGAESFGESYEMPNATGYNETCAAIANMMWNHRLFLLTGDARYMDVFERTLYNGFLSGVSLSGDQFFYVNPLLSDGKTKFNIGQAATRQPWFKTSCCPTNVARFFPSLPGYMTAVRDSTIYVSLFATSTATVILPGNTVTLAQETRYPWDGTVRLTVTPEKSGIFTLAMRMPGWAKEQPVPSDLYRFAETSAEAVTLSVNGAAAEFEVAHGFARLTREWQAGDTIELVLPMPVCRVLAHEQVEADAGRAAIQRGPVVYCAEGIDNGDRVSDLVISDEASFIAEHRPELLGELTVLTGNARRESGEPVKLTMIPYYAWSNRGEGEMAVWLKRR